MNARELKHLEMLVKQAKEIARQGPQAWSKKYNLNIKEVEPFFNKDYLIKATRQGSDNKDKQLLDYIFYNLLMSKRD